jgi:hypothetical protein
VTISYNRGMDSPAPRRRFQFRLRTLMIGVTLLAVPMGYIGWQAKIVAERKAWLRDDRDVSITPASSGANDIPWMRRWLGDFKVDEIRVRSTLFIDSEIVKRLHEEFPEATIRSWEHYGGTKIN